MRKCKVMLATLIALVGLSLARSASAAWLSAFVNGGPFDNDIATSTAPGLVDTTTGHTGTITTNAVSGGSVNENAGLLAISGAPNVASFDPTESWTFSWDQGSDFVLIDFGAYTSPAEDNAFSVQSAAFIGQPVTPGSANVNFNPVTGTFTFLAGTAADTFNAAALYGAGPVPRISTGTNITIAFNAAAGQAATIEQIGFSIPEPSSALLLAAGTCLLNRRRRRS